MLSDDIRQRLSQLHRTRDADSPAAAPRASASSRRHDPRAATLLADARDAFETTEECENVSGRHLRFRRPLADLWPASIEAIGSSIGREASADYHPELAAVAEHFPGGTLFLDLETCGFAGSPVFLAGVVRHADGGLVIEQLFARSYAEERALLESLWQIAATNRVLVTFNGKSFDWPMVHDRSTRHHLGRDARRATTREPRVSPDRASLGRRDPRPELLHCDLLHHARRRWKRVLPNCKLQTLERYVCRRTRHDDLGGAEVPAAYHEFVRTGATGRIAAILRHNALDLATLVQVTLKLLSASAARP